MTRFVHISDLHISHPDAGDTTLHTDTAAQVAQAVAAINRLDPAPDFVVASGDLTNIGDPDSYDLLQDLLAPLAMPLLLALGNHDRREHFHAAFFTGKEDAAHCHDTLLAGVHVITLDTSIPGRVGGTIDAAQFDFLAQALDRHPEAPKLIVLHHPPRHHVDELPWEALDVGATAALAQALQGRKVLGLLAGHVHFNAVRIWHGIPVYVTIGLNSTVDLLEPADMVITMGTGFSLFDLHPAGLTVTHVPLTPTTTVLGRIDATRLRAFS